MMFFFFNDTATTEIYTLSLHDALPISRPCRPSRPSGRTTAGCAGRAAPTARAGCAGAAARSDVATTRPPTRRGRPPRSEEHTSELQSRQYLVCRLLLEKKKIKYLISQS